MSDPMTREEIASENPVETGGMQDESQPLAEAGSGTVAYPWLGLISVTTATAISVAQVPADPEPQGALFIPALTMSLGLLIPPIVAAFREPKSLVRAEHLLALAPIYWILLDLLQAVYPMEEIDPPEARWMFVAIGLFVAGIWGASILRPLRLPRLLSRAVELEFTGDTLFLLALLSFVLGMFKFAYPCGFNPVEMWYYVGQGRWEAPWNRGVLGGADAFRDHMQYFGYLLPVLAVAIGQRAGWLNVRTFLAVAFSLMMAVFLAQEGGRRTIGVIFGMAIIFWMLSQQQLRARFMIPLALLAGVLLYTMQIMVEYRNVGYAAILDPEISKQIKEQQRDYIHVDDNALRLTQLIKYIPDMHPHTTWRYPLYVLIRPVPRFFWPGKPTDPGFDLSAFLGLSGVSLSSSVIGELYLSGGMVLVFFGGFLYGRLGSLGTRIIEEYRTFPAYLVFGTMCMALFAGVRSALDLMLISYVVMAWMGLAMLLPKSSAEPDGAEE